MATKQINLVQDFSDCPGGRYRHLGDNSGEEFREDHLRPAMRDFSRVVVNLNGAFTIPPSFLDESLGVLIQELGLTKFDSIFDVRLDDDPAALWDWQDVRKKRSGKQFGAVAA